MTVVVGTAGHIDHGKTTLLRALTGIDADRLPEERRRGMTIDVGYAHLTFDDGEPLDFVDVPGHDRLVGNMLVGAGEIDAAMLVVAADDGLRAQSSEHLALLDALAIRDAIVVVTKADVVEAGRAAEVVAAVERALAHTTLVGSPIVVASALTGAGLDAVRSALQALRDRVRRRMAARPARPPTMAIDRVFSAKGRGLVVTGSLRGGPLERGDPLRLVPGGATVRAREVQVHGAPVAVASPGRTALNLVGVGAAGLARGQVVTADPAVVETSRIAVALDRPWPDRTRARFHLGTAAVDAAVARSGRDAVDLPDGRALAVIRLAEPVAARAGDRFLLRRAGAGGGAGTGAHPVVGGSLVDVAPPRGLSRRRQDPERFAALLAAVEAGDDAAVAAARLELHGITGTAGRISLAPDVAALAADAAGSALPADAGDVSVAALRLAVARALRRVVTVRRDDAALAAATVVESVERDGRLVRSGDRVRRPDTVVASPDASAMDAMARLERALDTPTPPPLDVAAGDAGCTAAGIRALEAAGRIVILEPGLGYAASAYGQLTDTALRLARAGPMTPAAYRDATGTSRRYVMAILEDLDRRGVLRRTPAGHVPGPRAPVAGQGRA